MDVYQIEQQITGIEGDLRKLRTELKKLKDEHRKVQLGKEGDGLKKQARNVIVYLISLILLCSAGIVWLLLTNVGWSMNLRAALVSFAAGMLGSGVSAMLSALDRKANGWEFSDGTTYPDDDRKQRFSERMTYFFVARPYLGASVGLLVFVGGVSGFLLNVGNPPDLYKLTFLSLLAGLFAKTLLEKLKNVFDYLFGKK